MKRNHWTSAALGCLMALLVVSTSAYAATFTVTRFDDTNDFTCDEFDCSLREAIISANSTSGPDEIILPTGIYTLNLTGFGEDGALTGDLDITDDLFIFGTGPTQTRIDGNNIDRVFHIAPQGQDIFVSMVGLSIQNGMTPIGATTEDAAGGGLLNNGNLFLTDIHIKNNEAAYIGTGGGLHNLGNTIMFRGEVSSNFGSRGGGIYNEGSMELQLSSINANSTNASITDSSGGGIFNRGDLLIENSTVFDNTAAGLDGGGVYNDNNLSLVNSTVDNNTVTYGDGGGVYNTHLASFSNVTISNNEASNGFGGGILNDGTIETGNSLLAGNMASGYPSNCYPGAGVVSHGYNLEDFDSCSFIDPRDQFNTLPLLLQRSSNTGFTPTLGLQPESPAIDGGDPAGCKNFVDDTSLDTDQRALSRPVDGDSDFIETCDIGAVEYASTRPGGADLGLRVDDITGSVLVGETAIYQVTVMNYGPDSVTEAQLTIEFPASFNNSALHDRYTDLEESCTFTPGSDLLPASLICSLGSLQEGGTEAVTFTAQSGSAGEASVTVTISGDQTDNVPGNDSATVTTTALSADSLRLTSPDGGESLESGSSHIIEWTAPAEATIFKLRYSLDSGANWNRIDVVRNASSFNWSVPEVALTQPDSLIKVIAFDADGNKIGADTSDGTFTITPQATTMISPNGGETFYGGSPVLLEWTGTAEAVSYKIKLSLDNGNNWVRVDKVGNTTQTVWTVPVLPADKTGCLLKIIAFDAENRRLGVDVSDAVFSILQAVQVTTPNGGEVLSPGESTTIQWDSQPMARRFDVSYSMNNGAEWTPIGSVEDQHEIPWFVPSVTTTEQECLVRVVAFDSSDAQLAEDSSDGTFTIIGPVPAVVVTTLNNSEIIPYGEFVNISWTTENISAEIGQILLEYSLDSGQSWSTIKTLGPGGTSFDWRPPPVPAEVNTCKVRVTLLDLSGQEIVSDKNNGRFTLLEASGDPWNYFPFEQGSTWSYSVTETENGLETGTYPSTVEVAGTMLRLGVMTTIFRSSALGQTGDNYLLKDNDGIINYGTDIQDPFMAQLVPYQEGRFPLIAGESYVQFDKTGLDFGQDVDFDGRNEQVNVKSVSQVKKYVNVTVPAGSFSDCVSIKTTLTMTVTLSTTGQRVTATGNGRLWAAPGVGPVKSQLKTTVVFEGNKEVLFVEEKLLDYSIPLTPP